ncbi:MAG: putative DNA binding domain-containing protein [Christensenellaceae bacterium]|jgi:ATP-dependent DNA helicase RecG|nr:putative DNA binding domain-containing protein [Christensenellaceae bacterium]
MALPINVQDLIYARKFGTARVEHISEFDPLKVMHTMCAFANDINNCGGGYIILGIKALDGVPQFPVVGIEKEEQDAIYRKILKLSTLIHSKYTPIIVTEPVEEKEIIIIWAYAGNDRPYKCPVDLENTRTQSYYIRKCSNTVVADSDTKRRLVEVSASVPFDDRANQYADIKADLDITLMRRYLIAVKSKLFKTGALKLMELATNMRLIGGCKEVPKPLNVGLMFFNYNPEKFIRCARIELVIKPNRYGDGMTKKIFTGSVYAQLRDSLEFIKNNILIEKVFKMDDKEDVVRVWNYPYQCIQEILVNAVYHKGYNIPEPITVTVLPDKMEITSCPGPDMSISEEDIKSNKMEAPQYRNRRIGEFLKELDLAQCGNTGLPIALKSLRQNKSRPLKLKTDANRTYLTVTIQCHKSFLPEETDIDKTCSSDE